MDIEQLEQLAALIVTAGLVAGNFLLFTPWRNGRDPRVQEQGGITRQRGRFINFDTTPCEAASIEKKDFHGTNL